MKCYEFNEFWKTFICEQTSYLLKKGPSLKNYFVTNYVAV